MLALLGKSARPSSLFKINMKALLEEKTQKGRRGYMLALDSPTIVIKRRSSYRLINLAREALGYIRNNIGQIWVVDDGLGHDI